MHKGEPEEEKSRNLGPKPNTSSTNQLCKEMSEKPGSALTDQWSYNIELKPHP
jgi:hypothetical protein